VHFLGYLVNSLVKIIIIIQAYCRVDSVLGFFPSRPSWAPLSRKRVYPPGTKSGGDTLACWRGGGGPNSDERTDSVALGIYVLIAYKDKDNDR
jgi:hypothetical protein